MLSPRCKGLDDVSDFTIETRPMLLVGDCTRKWIEKYSGELNWKIRDHAYGAIYHGRNHHHVFKSAAYQGS